MGVEEWEGENGKGQLRRRRGEWLEPNVGRRWGVDRWIMGVMEDKSR